MDSKPFAQLLRFLLGCFVACATLIVVLFALLLASCASSDKVLRSAQDDNPQMSTQTPEIRGNYVALPDSLPKRRLLGLLLSSCRSADTSRASPEQPAAAVPVYADGGAPGGKLPGVVKGAAPGALAPPAPNAPRWQQRQYRKNLRAQPRTVPLIQGRAAVNAPLATQVIASYKPKAPVVLADSGADVRVATAGKNSQVAAGEGNVLEKVEPAGKPWQAYVFGPVGIALAVLLVVGVGYGVWQYRRARSIV